VAEGPLDEQLANDLLRENNRTKIGAWQLVQTGQGYIAVFAVQIGAEVDEQTLATAVRAVAVTADEKEKEVTQKDDL